MSSPSLSVNQATQNTNSSSTLRRGIWSFAGLIVLTLVGTTSFAIYTQSQNNNVSQSIQQVIEAKNLVSDIAPPPAYAIEAYVNVLEANRGRADIKATFNEFQQRETEYLQRVDHWKASPIPADIKQSITVDAPAALQDFWQQSKEVVFPILLKEGARSAVDGSKLNAALMQIENSFSNHRDIVASATTQAQQYLDSNAASAQTAEGMSDWTFPALAGLIGLMVLAALYALSRNVLTPLGAIARHSEGLTKGEDLGEIPFTERNNEIGFIASALNTIKHSNSDSLSAQKIINEERERAAKLSEEITKEREERDAETAKAVSQIGASLNRMAKGDFTGTVDTPFTGELEKLRADINSTLAQISQTFGRIVNTTESLGTGVLEIVTASDDLSVRTERQAASLEETAATLTQITATVKKSSEGAKHTKTVVETAKEDAMQSGAVVEKALSAMSEIEKSAKEINQIISVIDEIAFQTNLLALNAGVEAARAGDAGKGFAVVASEVRALAQRSAEAAKEIKGLISKSSVQVKDGSQLVGKTGETLHRIADQVIHISEVVDQIVSGADEQFQSLNELNAAVSDLDSGTQQNAAMAEEATAACHSLKAEASELTDLIKTFKISGNTTFAPRAPIQPPVRPAAKVAPSAPKARTAPTAPLAPSAIRKPAPIEPRKFVTSAKPVAINGKTTQHHAPAPSPAKNLISKVSSAFAPNTQGNTALQDDDWTEF
ncbi:methyl-accepting chemotaxis protein [Ahrensia sp. 13_GOM-1096m]|uniref:methyl-accepting chemotaxis protein n=1 Tax=Ahrensia sp. 13_GOM-1096m TaxID=1380380 RepID=UPI00138AFA7A|nr:methyl-accepting chemotaxis protein [Ahrensia sp. 13_GOM-1096m]